MQSLKVKLNSSEIEALMKTLSFHISLPKEELNDMLHQILLTKLYKRVRDKFENRSKSITLKPEEQLSLLAYFGINVSHPTYEQNLLNTINTAVHKQIINSNY